MKALIQSLRDEASALRRGHVPKDFEHTERTKHSPPHLSDELNRRARYLDECADELERKDDG